MGPLWYLNIIVALTPQTRSNATDEYEGSIPSLVTKYGYGVMATYGSPKP